VIIRTLSTAECTKLLAANRVARLACAKDGQPYVVPIYCAYADSHLYAFSMPDKKIEWMRGNPMVSLQVHEGGERREWKSVVVDGRYEEMLDCAGRDHAWSQLSRHFDWWGAGQSQTGRI
jgi:nitroimidazol reductase NimA-like FMN-containing flavoprotein (pyridoxamine 5'-phosphate oxidase superfamily)